MAIDLTSWFSDNTNVLALQAVAGGYGAMGSYNQASTQKASMLYEASVAENNSKIAGYQAQLAVQLGAQQAQAQEMKTASMYSDQRASMAANGVDLGGGSANEILATTQFMGGRDAMTIQDNAARQAWAYKNQEQSYLSEANADRNVAGAISPVGAGLTSLLGSAGAVASGWYKYNQANNGTPRPTGTNGATK